MCYKIESPCPPLWGARLRIEDALEKRKLYPVLQNRLQPVLKVILIYGLNQPSSYIPHNIQIRCIKKRHQTITAKNRCVRQKSRLARFKKLNG